ncbi:MAG: Coenzyme F420 hydrogenase/dehydrogenase, beta subunit C-terminal domain [Clostridia bacterium]|nr:Coenzyme F420 hydrogenase/dehydrogenase, beta subunit C-terminal domain [Clostridia bacterium]
MPSFLKDNLKQHCSGCGSCVQACTKKAITFKTDDDGFTYPLVDKDKCISCGRCYAVCPFDGADKISQNQKFYAVKSKSSSVIKDSSSGGAFYEIAKAFCDENYVVFGAEMCDNLKVRHSFIDDFSHISKLQKSKYVQSDINNSFEKVKEFLKENKKVLFSGTPCQIAGLRKFLGKDYDNLLAVDIVCHGVPNQQLFDKYIKELSESLGQEISSFTFRNKKNFEKKSCNQKTVLIKTNKGKSIVKEVLQCEYLAAFHEAMFYRPSCYECPFASTERVGDITLADFWGAEKFYSSFDDGKGVSLVIANTEKGSELLTKTEILFVETDKERAVANNAQLKRPVELHKNRDKFFELNREKSFCESVKECMDFPSPLHYKLYKIKRLLK